jgi:hypothetical protein
MELTIYDDGVAILTDAGGRTLWTSDDDDGLPAAGFPDTLKYEDGDALAEYLIDSGVIDEDDAADLEIVETDESGLHEIEDVDDEDDEDEDDDE